jgi:glucose/arabinose dehydrogenase
MTESSPTARLAGAAAVAVMAALIFLATGAEFGRAGTGFSVQTVAGGLEVPWAVARTKNDIVLTERPGRVRLIRAGRLVPSPIASLRVSAETESGLLGLALHPRYPKVPSVYLYYTYRSGGLQNRVSRFRLAPGGPAGLQLSNEKVLVDRIPAHGHHDGGRMAFGPDGMLYIATGDANRPSVAADRGSLGGKILRIAPDGSVPKGNPFPGSPIWSYGHRNVQGLAWDPKGRLYASEHGPTEELDLCCHDEINLIRPGRFYGWPLRVGKSPVSGDLGVDGAPAPPVDPIVESGSGTWAPAGMAYSQGSLFVAGLGSKRLFRFVLDPGNPSRVTHTEDAFEGVGRLRDVVKGGGGCLYATTSNRDGRGDPGPDDDRVLRLCPS